MNIGIWGDSITYGKGDIEALGWVGRLRKYFPIEKNVGVYNFGVPGQFVTDLLTRFEVEANSVKPSVVVIAIGINDSKYLPGASNNAVPLNEFEEKVNVLIKQAEKFTNKIYLVGTTKIVVDSLETGAGSIFKMKDIEIYNSKIKKIAENNSLTFIDVFETIDIKTDLSLDGLHPNALGYQKMFERIVTAIM